MKRSIGLSVLSLLMVIALANPAMAAPKKKPDGDAKKKRPAGTVGAFESASVEDGKVSITVKTKDGSKTFSLKSDEVTVMYGEKDGKKIARFVRVGKPKKENPNAKAKSASGKLTGIEKKGRFLAVTIGDDTYAMGANLRIAHKDGSDEAMGFAGTAGGGKKKADGDKPKKGKGKKKDDAN